jgi:hypothetical protein
MIPLGIGLDAVIGFLKRYRILILVLPLVMALGVQSCRLDLANGKLDKARNQIAQMQTASEAARQAQIALNQAREAAYKAESERTDHAHQIALNDARRRAAAYFAANRVRLNCESLPGEASATAQGATAKGNHRPCRDAVLLERTDFDTLNENTVRLKAVHEWGERLVGEGLATGSQPLPQK